MSRWIEVRSFVEDFGVPHWKEEWELVKDDKFMCSKCEFIFTTSASLKFHWRTSHVPTGRDHLALVKQYFSIAS